MSAFAESTRLLRAGLGRAEPGGLAAELIAREGFEGLLHARAVAAGAAPPTDARRRHARRAADNITMVTGLAAALRTLAAAGLEPVVLPGAALLRHYPDAGCRPMDDIDLLCPPGAGDRVRQVLRRAGWTPAPRHADLLQRGAVTLDLHTDPLNSDRIPARRRAGWLNPERVWAGRRRAELEGVPVWVLAAEDEILYTAAHALRHSYRRLTWLVDLRLQLHDPGLDAGRLAAVAAVSRLEAPLADGLALLKAAGADLPPTLRTWQAAHAPGRGRRAALRWTLAGRHTTCAGEVLWCLTCHSARDRARLLAGFVFPRPAVLLQVFPRVPRRLAPLAYVLRCAQLVGRAAAEAATLGGTAARGLIARRRTRAEGAVAESTHEGIHAEGTHAESTHAESILHPMTTRQT